MEKSATPTPYIETIFPGRNQIQGWVGTQKNGKVYPEKNAYIYVYVNGFLINPPDILPDGSFKNKKTAILSDDKGNWATGTFFFDVFPSFEYGATLTFRAKAPLKTISDISIPYVIGSTPTPINIGNYDSTGLLRPPYEGESSIYGSISYWFRQLPDFQGKQGYPLFQCDNHVYVYVDGVNVGTTSQYIGEVFKNEIRGIDAVYPITTDIRNQVLPIKIDTNQINIPLSGLDPVNIGTLDGIQDGVNRRFTFALESIDNAGMRIFKNGQRLTENLDYTYGVVPLSNVFEVNFTEAPNINDALTILFQYNIAYFVLHDFLIGLIDGNNKVFTLSKQCYPGTLELFKNGIKLNSITTTDYVQQDNIITFENAPEIGDLLIADYQLVVSNIEQYRFTTTLSGIIDGTNQYFFFNKPLSLGNVSIFRNGLLQKQGNFFDYELEGDGNVVKFTPRSIPQIGDILNITYNISPISLNNLIEYLNQLDVFQLNCLQATIAGANTNKGFFTIEGVKNGVNRNFVLPISDRGVLIRLYKNGKRLVETSTTFINGDYSIDYKNSTIIYRDPPIETDLLVGIYNYKTTGFIVGEKPQGNIDGSNDTFSLALLPSVGSLQVYKNGIRLNPFGLIYHVENNNIIFDSGIPVSGDVLVVDYEVAYSLEKIINTIHTTPPVPDGVNTSFQYPLQETGTSVNVFVNGLLQTENIDFIFSKTSPPSILFIKESSIPPNGSSIFLDLNLSNKFIDNPKDQLRIVSPYPIELISYPEADLVQKTLFGTRVELYPGKDDDGEFRFWINRQTGMWKWTWYDPITKVTQTFKAGQHITARAYNSAPVVYTERIS